MTIPPNPYPEQVEAIQDDRNAAADSILRRLEQSHGGYQLWMAPAVQAIRDGEQDDHWDVQAFARHRLTSLANRPTDDGDEYSSVEALVTNSRTGEAFVISLPGKPDHKRRCEIAAKVAHALSEKRSVSRERNDEDIISEFAFLYRTYGVEHDANLATDALELKRKVLAALVPYQPEGVRRSVKDGQQNKQAFRAGAVWAVGFQAGHDRAPDLNDVEAYLAVAMPPQPEGRGKRP